MTKYRLSLPATTPEEADPQAKIVLDDAKTNMGMVPNMYANMANSPGLLTTYSDGYNRFRENSGFSPAEQETVLLTISRHNGCAYCMAAHSMIADKVSGVAADDLKALRNGETLPDDKLNCLNVFTRHLLESHGLPGEDEVKQFLAAGYTERHILEIVLAMAVKLLSNYSNHLFETKVDDAFADYTWSTV